MGKKDPTKPGVVYVVWDKKEPNRVRYVGRTVQGIPTRASKHWGDCLKHKTAFPNWLRSRLDRKGDVVFEEVSWHPNVAELNQAEKDAIAHYRALGQADLNLTDGGDGGLGIKWDEKRVQIHFESVPRGDRHVWSKLNKTQVDSIRARAMKEPVNSVSLAKEYGVCVATMTEMLRNETWYDPSYDPQKWKKFPTSGETARNARLTWEQVREIRASRQEVYEPASAVASRYGVTKDMIRLILLNKNWFDPDFDPTTIIPRKGRK